MPQPPFDNKQWKMPGYTGHIMGTFENYAKTPVHVQEMTKRPETAPAAGQSTDPSRWEIGLRKEVMNYKDYTHKGTIDKREQLWPNLAEQTETVTVAKKNELRASSITLGDERYREYYTHQHRVHSRPGSARQTGINNGVPNFVAMATKTTHEVKGLASLPYDKLRAKYDAAIEKANNGPMPLAKLRDNISLRFRGKINVMSNRNGFAFKQIFQAFDVDGTGNIDLEEFKSVLSHYGLQFDDYVYLALFGMFDTNCNGTLDYREFMGAVLDVEYYSMAFGAVGAFKPGVDDADNVNGRRYSIAK